MSRSLHHKSLALFLVHACALVGVATPRTRPRLVSARPAKIVFEPNDRVIQPAESTAPTDIVLTPNSIDLTYGTKATIVAKVFDAAGNELHGLNVTWQLADKQFKDLVFLGPPVNNATTNSIDVVWLYKQGQKQTQVPIIALVGTASAVANITYEPEEKGNGNELMFFDDKTEIQEVTISPTEKKTVSASVKLANPKGTVLLKPQLDCDVSDDDRDFITVNTKTAGEISLVGLGGNLDTSSRTILLPCRAQGTSATLVIHYVAGNIGH